MVVKYEDATDIKIKHDRLCVKITDIIVNNNYFLNSYDELGVWIKNEFIAWYNKEVYFKQFKVESISFEDGYVRVFYKRHETEKEYYSRKKQEELEYMQHLSCVEKEKYLAKEKIRKKYQQYEELRKYFENQNIEELLKE